MPGALAAYNAGPARYEEYKLLGVPLPSETIAYLGKLAPILGNVAPGLFAGSGTHAAGAPRTSLFAIDATAQSRASASATKSLFATDKRRGRSAGSADSESPGVQTE